MKPRYGNLEGKVFAALPGQWEACHKYVDRRVKRCKNNTKFDCPVMNRKNKDCLPAFEEQASACAAHFAGERAKCDAGGIGVSSAPRAGHTRDDADGQ